ncbi:MAG: hypothetical protein HUJ29_11450 [Gammaproteobacteria bacterium]|nr:hypothetical protein [Gammaproteobacteria bacterium]
MAIPLGSVLAAAPGVISAASEIMELVRKRKGLADEESGARVSPDQVRLNELAAVVEKQAEVIEELAQNNNDLALAVRTNRIISGASLFIAFAAIVYIAVS